MVWTQLPVCLIVVRHLVRVKPDWGRFIVLLSLRFRVWGLGMVWLRSCSVLTICLVVRVQVVCVGSVGLR